MNSFNGPVSSRTPKEALQPSINVLNQISSLLSRLTPDQISDLEAGTIHVGLVPADSSASIKRRSKPKPALETIVEQMMGMKGVKDGVTLLESQRLPRRSLEEICRLLDLPVNRSDNAAQLRARIAEATIGYRSRSEAIQSGGNPGGD